MKKHDLKNINKIAGLTTAQNNIQQNLELTPGRVEDQGQREVEICPLNNEKNKEKTVWFFPSLIDFRHI